MESGGSSQKSPLLWLMGGVVLGIGSVFAVGSLAGMHWVSTEDVVELAVESTAEPGAKAGASPSGASEEPADASGARAEVGVHPVVVGDVVVGDAVKMPPGAEPSAAMSVDPQRVEPAEHATAEQSDGEPEVIEGDGTLSASEIDRGFESILPRIRACAGPLIGGKRGDRVKVKVRIDRATGRVLSVEASSGRSGVESCVESAVLAAKFAPDGEGVQEHTRTVTL